MHLKKILAAGSMGLLMAGSSIAFAATLGDYPAPFVTSADGVQSFVVVGADAAPSDVVGAIDIAARLGGAITTERTATTTTTAVTLSGKSEEISLDYNITEESGTFPVTLKNHHVPALGATIKIPWEYQTDGEVDAHEEFVLGGSTDAGGINMSRNPMIYNGTIFLQVPDPIDTTQQAGVSAPFYYKYVFDETMETSQANMSSVKPLRISILGRTFDITAIPQTYQIKALTGDQLDIEFGSSGETSGGFTVTPTAYTSDNYWYIKVEKADASQEKKLLVGSSTDTEFTVGSEKLKVRVISNITKTTLVDGVETTVKVISLAAGSTTELIYDEQSSTTLGSSTQGNNSFPGGNGDWKFDFYIQNQGHFTNNDWIAVYYDPWDSDDAVESPYNGNSLNLTVGEKISMPNNYFDIEFAAMNTETYATVTVDRTLVNLYWNGTSDTTTHWSNRPAVKLITTGGTFVNGTAVDKNEVYIVFNTTVSDPWEDSVIYLAMKDSNGLLRNEVGPFSLANQTADQYVFALDYGDYSDTLKVFIANTSLGSDLYDIKIADYLGDTVLMNYTIDSTAATTSDRIYLGDALSDVPAATDIVVSGTPSVRVYRDYYTGYGVKAEELETNARSDRATLKVPLTRLKGIVAIGKDISVGGAAATYQEATPITTALGKLDTEIGDTEKSTKNLILVGGPCVNDLVKTLADGGKITYQNTTLTCDNWISLSGEGDMFAIIQLVEDAFVTGKSALVVAGSGATQTRDAAKILLDYESYASSLAGKAAVVVRGTTVTELS